MLSIECLCFSANDLRRSLLRQRSQSKPVARPHVNCRISPLSSQSQQHATSLQALPEQRAIWRGSLGQVSGLTRQRGGQYLLTREHGRAEAGIRGYFGARTQRTPGAPDDLTSTLPCAYAVSRCKKSVLTPCKCSASSCCIAVNDVI